MTNAAVGSEEAKYLTYAKEDCLYAKISLGVEVDQAQGFYKILGVECNDKCGDLQLDIGEVVTAIENSEPTIRSVVSTTARFFFCPLWIVSPVTVIFKMFAQQFNNAGMVQGEVLTCDLSRQLEKLLAMLRGAKTIMFS